MSTPESCEDSCPHTHSPLDAATRLGISESALRQKAGRRRVPSTLINGRLRFTDSDIAQIIADGQRPALSTRRTPRRRTR
ncbi:hypothetical protein [Actinomadura nitritigenes]|uniref:hypothetical protein n=1 Tax=Actinomadura nitritigenes TaxID=134602 RepID=UPI003D8D356D